MDLLLWSLVVFVGLLLVAAIVATIFLVRAPLADGAE
jgi:hypothetical protein